MNNGIQRLKRLPVAGYISLVPGNLKPRPLPSDLMNSATWTLTHWKEWPLKQAALPQVTEFNG